MSDLPSDGITPNLRSATQGDVPLVAQLPEGRQTSPAGGETVDLRKGQPEEPCQDAGQVLEQLEQVEALVETANQSASDTSDASASISGETADPMIGRQIASYKICERLGQGGMGTVYRAFQTDPVKRDVALKVLSLDLDDHRNTSTRAREQFISEGQVLATLSHPEIAMVLDADVTESGNPFFVMELVEGKRLDQFAREHKLTTRDRIRLVQRICRAVHHAHQQGVVHRDLKPPNILVGGTPESPVVKVIDFGIAKVLEGNQILPASETVENRLIGTPGYMSPEQASCGDIDARADVYSLGAILFQLLCDAPPINRQDTPYESLDELLQLSRTFSIPRPSQRLMGKSPERRAELASTQQCTVSELVRQCKVDLDWVVLKALEKDRRQRYATANDFADDLQRVLDQEPTHAAAPTLLYRARKLAARHPISAIAGSGLLVVAVLIATQWKQAQDQHAAQHAFAIHQSDRWMDQADTLRRSVDAGDERPQHKLNQATTLLERTRFLLAFETDLQEAERRRKRIAEQIESDERAFDFVAQVDHARHLAFFPEGTERGSSERDSVSRSSVTRALCGFGVYPGETKPEVAVEAFGGMPSGLAEHVVEAFDFVIAQTLAKPGRDVDAGWHYEVVRCLDRNEIRNELRRAIIAKDWDAINRVAQLDCDGDQLPYSRIQLAVALSELGKRSHSTNVLRKAAQTHPENYWVNLHLGIHLAEDDASRVEALRYLTAAAALRPDSPTPPAHLANVLESLGRDEEAKMQRHRAKRLQF